MFGNPFVSEISFGTIASKVGTTKIPEFCTLSNSSQEKDRFPVL